MSRNALSWRGVLVAAAMFAPLAPAAEQAAPSCYVKKATWYETLIASREALMETEAKAASAAKAAPGGFQPFRAVIGACPAFLTMSESVSRVLAWSSTMRMTWLRSVIRWFLLLSAPGVLIPA